MLKAAAGGGGIGIVACFSKDEMIAKSVDALLPHLFRLFSFDI